MALADRWYKLAGPTPGGFSALYSAFTDLPTFGPVVDGNGAPVDLRVKATIDTSIYSIQELDDLAARCGWLPSTDPNE